MSVNPRKNRCEHKCPVCGGEAYPLGPGGEGDVPWRLKMGRIAHKCYGPAHRFDVDVQTWVSLPNFAIRPHWGEYKVNRMLARNGEKPLSTITAKECNQVVIYPAGADK